MFTWKYEGKGSRKRVGLHEGWSFVKHPCTEKYKGKGFRKNICAQRNTKEKISGKTFVHREIQRERFQEKHSCTEKYKGMGFKKNIGVQRNTNGKVSGKTFMYREIQRERFQEKWSLTERWSLIRGSSVFADFIVVTRLVPLSITGVNVPLCLPILL